MHLRNFILLLETRRSCGDVLSRLPELQYSFYLRWSQDTSCLPYLDLCVSMSYRPASALYSSSESDYESGCYSMASAIHMWQACNWAIWPIVTSRDFCPLHCDQQFKICISRRCVVSGVSTQAVIKSSSFGSKKNRTKVSN